jgi:hypothetical protein
MTGVVKEVKGVKLTHCRILATTNEVFFAHRSDFADRSAMSMGTEVQFEIKKSWHGRFRAATDVVAIQEQVA